MTHPSPERPLTGRLRALSCGAALALCALSPAAALDTQGMTIALADWAASLPDSYRVEGVKTEPFTVLAVTLWREGDLFAVLGGAPGHEVRAFQGVTVSATGLIAPAPCPDGARCGSADGRAGFLATAALVALSRAGTLSGTAPLLSFAGHEVVCLDATILGTRDPIFDPCLERLSGAVLAQRHRESGRFEGPSLSPSPLVLTIGADE